uniref:Uncharacterized protein n=1 Tax=Brassica oleracea TaxID=3712 RepID=A0A3P6EQ95_BRAOL|nr:unnamed protein product [Brassica oleracea]
MYRSRMVRCSCWEWCVCFWLMATKMWRFGWLGEEVLKVCVSTHKSFTFCEAQMFEEPIVIQTWLGLMTRDKKKKNCEQDYEEQVVENMTPYPMSEAVEEDEGLISSSKMEKLAATKKYIDDH